MIECIRFRSALPFDENVKEEFISEVWGGAIDRWRGNITPDVETSICNALTTRLRFLSDVDIEYLSMMPRPIACSVMATWWKSTA